MQLKKMFLKVFMFFMSLVIMEKKRLHGILLSFLMILSTLFTGINATVFAEGTPKIVDATITDFRIEKPKGTEVSELNRDASFYLAMDWKIKDASAQLHTGDYFDIQLPNNLRFPPSYAQTDFTLTDSEGNVIANAHVTHGSPNEAGGTIRVTFNEGINGKYNVHGTIYLGALFNKQKTVDNQKNTFEISVNGETASTELKVVKVGLPADSMVSKWGTRVIQGGQAVDEVQWYASLNYRKSDLENCVISDTLTGDATYIPGTFHLYEVELNDQGGIVKEFANVDLTGKLTLDNANKTFSINLGSVGKKQYRLTYKTTYVAGTTLKNHIKVVYDGGSGEGTSTVKDSTAGGTAGGDLANKIKLIKVDADDNAITLANAVFKVTRPDGTKFELTTGADGTVTSGALTSGTYKVKEKTAPIGYELNGDEYTLQVTSSGGAIQTITNKQIKTSVSVEKEWIGQPATSVTVKLLADNVEKESIVLNAGNNWKHTFNNLPKHDRIDGHEIVYTVKEEQIANYDPAITGDMASGFKITNTNTEKISIPVEKKWVGPAKNEVEVELLADGKATNQKITLNQGTNWKGEFKDLYKYDKDDGHEIEYRVKEKKISGYETVISGTAKSGYTITNTIAGKVSIAVRKEWVGKEGNSATIRLIANGKEILSTTLDSAHNWRHTFAGLEKYKDGVEIKYEIKEDAIANYESEITGNVANGFVVKNTNTEKVSVRVEKKWNGPKQTSVKVNLMADGVVHKQIELNEAGQWKGEFKELAKYAPDGHEIEYTVKEETPMNYESKITGNQQSGYTITNTNIEKVSVSVEKKWIGKEGALAKVELLADGVVKERVTLSKVSNDWKYRFTNLAKYASDGHEIEYTVREEKVEGYETTISGTAKSGYTITNRITGKVTIAVRKKWIGKEGNRVVVNLYANGKKVGSQALTKDKDWQYTFTNLEKYENGQEIEYTVKEEKVEGYTTKIEGDMKSGYTIINKENSKKAKTPRTSDDHQGMMYGGLLMSSIMTMLGIVIMKRREME